MDWLVSRHSFAYGANYDPANTHHGVLLVNNEDVVSPGAGFEPHPHRDMEIVTWVLSGSLVHQDSAGHSGVIYPGLAQRMSAGRGVLHSEVNDAWRLEPDRSRDEPVHLVQMWVPADEGGGDPDYEQLEVSDHLRGGALVPVVSGRADHAPALRMRNRQAALHAARLEPGGTVELPDAPYVHVFVALGSATLEGAGTLGPGDAVRLTGSGARRVTGLEPAEILVWEMHASL